MSEPDQAQHSWLAGVSRALPDLPVLSLIVSNLIAIAWALIAGWSLVDMMWVYWFQSVSIGVFVFARLVALPGFSLKYARSANLVGADARPTRGTKARIATAFFFHYGGFQTVHVLFLLEVARRGPDGRILPLGGVFFANELLSFWHDRRRARRQKEDIGRVFFSPYLRIIPMHLTLFVGAILRDELGIGIEAPYFVPLFLALKTVADVGMYLQSLRGFAERPSKDYLTSGRLTRWIAGLDVDSDIARKILQMLGAVYTEPHEYRTASATDFSHLDLRLYQRTGRKLEGRGFRKLGDVEDVTLTRVFPHLTTCQRFFVGEDGVVVAGIFQFKDARAGRLRRFLRSLWPVFVIDLQTELSDGCFILTTNCPAMPFSKPPEVMVRQFPREGSVASLLDTHLKAVRRVLAEKPGAEAVAVHSLEEVLESENRRNAAEAAHRRSIPGMISEEELLAIAPHIGGRSESIVQEMERLRHQQASGQ